MEEEVERIMAWFKNLNEKQKNKVVRHLFEHATETEWIAIRDDEDAYFLASETDEPIEKYLGAYFINTGESLAE